MGKQRYKKVLNTFQHELSWDTENAEVDNIPPFVVLKPGHNPVSKSELEFLQTRTGFNLLEAANRLEVRPIDETVDRGDVRRIQAGIDPRDIVDLSDKAVEVPADSGIFGGEEDLDQRGQLMKAEEELDKLRRKLG